MRTIFESRRRYGECYVSRLPDGLEIPWNPLNLKDFIEYDLQIRSGRLPLALIEDEIFQKCVLDPNIKMNIDATRAGIVSTVVAQILDHSGPKSPEQIKEDLNLARHETDNFLHESISIILQTFPGYTFDKVYGLPYKDFLQLLVLAEKRLMAMGLLQQPLEPVTIQEDVVPAGKDRFKDLNQADPYIPPQPVQRPRDKPAPRKNEDVIISADSNGQLLNMPEGMTPQDREVYMHMHADKWKHDAMEGMDLIYPELMGKLRSGEKITPDIVKETRGRTPEEVKAKRLKYKKAIADGKITYKPSQPMIASGNEEGAKPKAKRNKR